MQVDLNKATMTGLNVYKEVVVKGRCELDSSYFIFKHQHYSSQGIRPLVTIRGKL